MSALSGESARPHPKVSHDPRPVELILHFGFQRGVPNLDDVQHRQTGRAAATRRGTLLLAHFPSSPPKPSRVERLISSGDVVCTEPILMEVTAGARSDGAAAMLRRLLTSFQWVPTDPVADFEGAATLYRSCRVAGITPRGLIDCMIVTIAISTGLELLTADREFEAIASVGPLRLAAT